MKRILILSAVLASFGLVACSDETDTTPYADPNCKASAWQNNKIPPCTIPVSISMTDPNHVYKDGEAQWKGSFMYDSVTRVGFYAADWNGGNGPFVPLYDDGPWSGYAAGNVIKYGHEATGEAALDGVFGATMFVYPPSTATTLYEYGMVDHAFGDGWIWKGSNGTFSVAVGATAPIKATSLTLDTFGTTDMQLHLDTANLDTTCTPVSPATTCTPLTWDFAGGIKVKGSAWGWYEVATTAVGGVYSFTLSSSAGAGNPLYHTGLLGSCATPQFVFVLYAADGKTNKEYKVGGAPPTKGVTAGTKVTGATTWTAATVTSQATGDKNTYITAPPIAPATVCN